MTIEGLLKACGEQRAFPQVRIQTPVQNSKVTTGVVTQIKPSGCAVRFNDMSYDSWFWAIPGNDKRSKYMSELGIINKP